MAKSTCCSITRTFWWACNTVNKKPVTQLFPGDRFEYAGDTWVFLGDVLMPPFTTSQIKRERDGKVLVVLHSTLVTPLSRF